MIIDFSNRYILLFTIVIFLLFSILGIIKKRSFYSLITLIFSVIALGGHTIWGVSSGNIKMNLMVDFIFLAIAIFLYLYVNDIEARRKVISEVFEDKFKKKK